MATFAFVHRRGVVSILDVVSDVSFGDNQHILVGRSFERQTGNGLKIGVPNSSWTGRLSNVCFRRRSRH